MTGAQVLPAEAWTPEPSSLVDPVGQIIHYEGRVLRGIRPQFVEEVSLILHLAERHRWFDHGLVPTWRTDLATTDFPMVIEHQRVPFVTVRGEWPAEALRQAALRYVELTGALVRQGYGLKDAHTWNVLFDGVTPRIIDFGSIRPIREVNWTAWLTEFRRYFLAPLSVFASGRTALARALLREHLVGAGIWFLDHLPEQIFQGAPPFPTEPATDPLETLEALSALIRGLTFPHTPTEWTAYAQPAAPGSELRPKDRLVRSLIDRLDFSTAIDLGANRGLHTAMCAARGASVLACDIDESCLDAMFRAASPGERVLPLYLDVVMPAPAGGLFHTIAPATERLQSDLVLALALVHHVCLRWQVSAGAFVEGIAAFTRRAVIVEFVPPDDWHVLQWGVPTPSGYSLDEMHAALARVFERVERIASEPAPRCLFVAEGKRRPGTVRSV